jgi:hypothetical protein
MPRMLPFWRVFFTYVVPLLIVGGTLAAAFQRSKEKDFAGVSEARWQTALKLWSGYAPSCLATYFLTCGYFWLASWLGIHERTNVILQAGSGGMSHEQPPLGYFITPLALLGLLFLLGGLCWITEEFWKAKPGSVSKGVARWWDKLWNG